MAACGAALASCYLPGGHWLPYWFVFIPYLWVIEEKTPGKALLMGWVFGSAAWLVGAPWMLKTIEVFLRVGPAQASVFFAGFTAVHGFMFALPAWAARFPSAGLSRRFKLRSSSALALAFLPAMLVIDGYYPQLFPVRAAGSQLSHLPNLQLIETLGNAGLGLLLLSFNAALFAFLRAWTRERALPRGLAAGMLVLLALAAGNEAYGRRRIAQVDADIAARAASRGTLKVSILQGSLAAEVKNLRERFSANLGRHLGLMDEAMKSAPDLVLWPETTYERVVEYPQGAKPQDVRVEGLPLPEALRRDIPHGVHLLLSAIGEEELAPGSFAPDGRPKKVHNISLLVGPGKEFLGLIEKRHLIPFGEYMPLGGVFKRLKRMSPNTWNLTPGTRQELLVMKDGTRIGVLICYEDGLPEYSAGYSRLGADLLVTQTSDTWFGPQMAENHLRAGALRAVEGRKYLARAVNTGVSAVVDPVGRVVGRLEPDERGVLSVPVVRMEACPPQARLGGLVYSLSLLLLIAVLLSSRP